MSRRVVVTGIGLVSSVGVGTEETWAAIKAGKNGITRITSFDTEGFNCQIAGEVQDFDPLQFMDRKEVRKVGRFIVFGIAASEFAFKQCGLKVTDQNAHRVGVYIGSGIGGFEIIEREHKNLLTKGPNRISPFFIPATIVNLASGHVSIRTGAKGPNSATATACTTSAHSIGDSYKIIERNDADVMICGGAEASITPMGIGGFASMRALSQRNDDPEHASRPWDKERDGFIVGEGSGILVLEAYEHAKARGAEILAEIVGYGMSGDAHHITAPAADGDGAIRVMRNALADAGLEASDIDYVNAHGTSTPVGDKIEATAVKAVFGENEKFAVSSTKSMTGHLLGGAGGLEAGITIMAMRDQIAPPTMNYLVPDPEITGLDFVPNQARPMEINYALSNSFGFGGTNGCLIFKRFSE